MAVPQPDVLISADGHNVGVRGPDGRLHLMRTAKDAFLLKEWLAADADPRAPTDASLADGVSCDEAGCVTPVAGGGLVALALRPEALADDCERAALVVTARQAPPACASAAMSGDRLRGQGTTALRRTRDGFARRRRQAARRRPAMVAGGRGRYGDGGHAGVASTRYAAGGRNAGGSGSANGGLRLLRHFRIRCFAPPRNDGRDFIVRRANDFP